LLSFLNMLASGLTWGLLLVPHGAALEEVMNLFNGAVARSRESGEAVTVIFE
jgi:hypothetical protein